MRYTNHHFGDFASHFVSCKEMVIIMRDYSFGNFLHELRKRRGLSQYQLGMLVGVSDKAVSKWENGSAKPQSRILYKLSDVLGVTVDELLACKYRSAKSGNEKGVFAMTNKLWKNAHQTLRKHYGDELPVEILIRYLSEFAELKETDMIVYFDLLCQIKAMAENLGDHIRVKGVTGASFIAFVLGATEINPLKPHYFCPHCKTVEFDETTLCGWDLPKKRCSCGRELCRDGHNLPFETLRPYIHKNIHFELSVSSELYQAVEEKIKTYFKGNTIVALVRKEHPYLKTLVIINENLSDFTDGQELSFDEYYNELRQYPTITLMINEDLDSFRLLEQETGISFKSIDFACQNVLEAFQNGNTDGIPEFQASFFKDMINEASPASFNDLIQISGLSHTDIWTNDAQMLIKNGKSASEVIAYRDDVFNYIQKRIERKRISNTGYAYKIMEDTRRGVYAKGGISDEMKQQFSSLGIEDWFAESIGKIQYLFPRAHGVLYVKYALILMWYKLNYPEVFVKYFYKINEE